MHGKLHQGHTKSNNTKWGVLMSIIDTIKNLFCKKSNAQETDNTANNIEPIQTEAQPDTEKTVEAEEVKSEEKPKQEEPKTEPVKEIIEKPQQTAPSKINTTNKRTLPEDSALKRHFLATLKAEVESTLSKKPTDSTLKRHYDSLVQSKIDELLK